MEKQRITHDISQQIHPRITESSIFAQFQELHPPFCQDGKQLCIFQVDKPGIQADRPIGFRGVQHFFVCGVRDYIISVGIGIQEGIYKLRCDLVGIIPVVVETSKIKLDGRFSQTSHFANNVSLGGGFGVRIGIREQRSEKHQMHYKNFDSSLFLQNSKQQPITIGSLVLHTILQGTILSNSRVCLCHP